uniref:Uncharacterized protein n=1 Tax=Canis lupus familiaris TaxID=9615 RepID=A0A8C0TH57_CANLF
MASGCKIGLSILNSDLDNLGAECLRILDSGAGKTNGCSRSQWIHLSS